MKISSWSYMILCCFVAGSLILHMGSCTHDDENLIIDPGQLPTDYGNDVIDTDVGWNLDLSHSSVRWETKYRGSGALLSGRFNDFDVAVKFVENDPNQISFVGSVDMFTINTGQPGRDTGCLVNTLGMNNQPVATLTSKSVEFDDKGGYRAVADLSFNGITSEVDVILSYTGQTFVEGNNSYNLAGLNAQFEMSAQSIFGVQSSSIDNRVVVHLDVNFRQAL